MIQETLPNINEIEDIVNNISQKDLEVMYERDYLKNESYSIGATLFDLLTTIEYDSDDIIDMNGRNERQRWRKEFLKKFYYDLELKESRKIFDIIELRRKIVRILRLLIVFMRD